MHLFSSFWEGIFEKIDVARVQVNFNRPRQTPDIDPAGSGQPQGPGRLGGGGTSGHYVIDQGDMGRYLSRHPERPGDIGQPFTGRQTGLDAGGTNPY